MSNWKNVKLNSNHEDEGRFAHDYLNNGITNYCCDCGEQLTTENCHEVFGPKQAPVYNFVMEPGDHDGKTWRAFCDSCYESAKERTADEVCEQYEPSKWELTEDDTDAEPVEDPKPLNGEDESLDSKRGWE